MSKVYAEVKLFIKYTDLFKLMLLTNNSIRLYIITNIKGADPNSLYIKTSLEKL